MAISGLKRLIGPFHPQTGIVDATFHGRGTPPKPEPVKLLLVNGLKPEAALYAIEKMKALKELKVVESMLALKPRCVVVEKTGTGKFFASEGSMTKARVAIAVDPEALQTGKHNNVILQLLDLAD